MSLPPLATAEATIAICSGVTASLSWPIADAADVDAVARGIEQVLAA